MQTIIKALDFEFKFYLSHEKEYLTKYEGKYIVIIGSVIYGVFNSLSDAYNESIKKYEVGTFLIQHCIKDGYKRVFHSSVAFRNE